MQLVPICSADAIAFSTLRPSDVQHSDVLMHLTVYVAVMIGCSAVLFLEITTAVPDTKP